MGTTAEKLAAALASKEDLRKAIIEKGQSAEETLPFKDYAAKVRAITQSVTPSIDVSDTGLITATAGEKSSSLQMATIAGQTITAQKTLAKGSYLTGNVVFQPVQENTDRTEYPSEIVGNAIECTFSFVVSKAIKTIKNLAITSTHLSASNKLDCGVLYNGGTDVVSFFVNKTEQRYGMMSGEISVSGNEVILNFSTSAYNNMDFGKNQSVMISVTYEPA